MGEACIYILVMKKVWSSQNLMNKNMCYIRLKKEEEHEFVLEMVVS